MRRTRITLLLAAALPAAVVCQGLHSAKVDEIERAVSSHMARLSVPGVSVSVSWNGREIWSNGYGLSDLENFVPVKASTSFRLGSISKSISAVAAMKLVETGKLDLDAPIQRYVPAFPEKPWPVTLRQLLSHQSGIRHYRPGEIESTRHYPSLERGLDIFKDDPLLAEPGTRYSYTTYGYTLVGCAVEAASGKRFDEFLREAVFEPAAMRTIRVDSVFELIPNRAQGYQRGPGGSLLNSGLADTSYKIPGGGLCSAAEDLVRFANSLMGERLVSKATLEAMWEPQRLKDGSLTSYGLGFVIESRNGIKVVSHSGGQQRVNTCLLFVPERKVAVAVMCNLEGAQPVALARSIAAILLPELAGPNQPPTLRQGIVAGWRR